MGANPVLAVGLMSGTSMDGIDAALLQTDGEAKLRPVAFLTVPYDAAFRTRLAGAVAAGCANRELERELTRLHADAVRRLIQEAAVAAEKIALIGFHGHTVLHSPAKRRTVQIGDGAALARMTGIAVVDDFRSADVAAGGEGAPLAPVFHRAIAAGLERPLATLNVGGVANVTWIGSDGALLAFDTGPGNALIDDWAMAHIGRPLDAEGRLASAGKVDEPVLAELMRDAYFARRPPKSLDRNHFEGAVSRLAGLGPEDGAATLTHFTAAAVAAASVHLPEPPLRWIVTGGGRRNPTLMAALGLRLGAPVAPIEAIGWDGDAIEAQAFAYMAVRSRRGLPISFPQTTGAPHPMTGGRFHALAG
ncbi:MAG TPA: anhydro-N-acetylmuramic acid kinase [Alphaproteobacteria bacterium]|nr:anhydro-N-acetylmuramic acid kinase [Alphaproteobacteria bacterium]